MARQMKDSGIAWIGEIPETWSTDRLQWHLDEVNVSNSPVQSENILSLTIEAGVIPYEEKGNQGNKSKENYEEYKLAYPDTLVVNSMNVIIGAVGISKYFGCVSPVYYVFRAATGTDLRYVYYLFTNVGFQKEMRKHAKGILEIRLRISSGDMQKLSVPNPEYEEQRRIADFLDRHCAEIDAVMERTKATIEEYKKLKQAVITEAVTKGVRGERKMKDSGIEWIGEIPEGWTTAILKYSIRWKSEKGQPDATVLSLYRDYGVVPKDSRDDNHNVTSLDTSAYKVVSVGDFVINKMKAWQGSMAVSDFAGIVSPAYHVCEITNPTLNKRYLHHLLRNHLYIPEYTRLSTGMRIGQWDLGFDDFKNLPFIIPPIDEQAEIVEYIENGLSQYDTLIAKKTALLTELETYKKSLIYEYVTGKKEVQ